MAYDFAIFLKFVSFFGVLWSCKAFFDIDELNSINYGIELIPKPVLLGEVGSGAHHILLSTKHGQQYQCTFQDKNIQAEKENKEEQSAKDTGIPELLKPMEDGPCLLANKGWWTYEFCYGKQISQYHMDDGKIMGKTLVLGVYHSEYNWEKEADEKAKKERLRRYHSQQYSNGSLCDLTSQPRQSEVRFVCDDSTGDFISTIDESESCVYIITVHTPRICHHPYLKPTRISKSVPIKCNPVLGQDDFSVYLNEVEVAKKKKEQLEKEKAALRDAEKKAVSEFKIDDILADGFGSDAMKDTNKVVDKLKDILLNVMRMRTETGSERSERSEQLKRYRKLATKRLNKDGDVIEYEEGKGDEADEDSELYAEFDKALSDMATDPEKSKLIPTLKDHLKEAMQGEFTAILKEAQEELKSEGQDTVLDERVALKSLADTLGTLLEKLDKSAKAVTEMEEKVKQSAMEAQAAREKLMDKLVADEKPKPKLEDKDAPKPPEETAPSVDEDPTDPDPESVTVRVTQRKVEELEDNILKFDKGQEDDLNMDERKQLESQVKAELKRAGLDTKGQKIQVKIITGLSKGGEKITDEDATTFKRMVVAILGRNADEDAAAEKEETLMSAYNYRWRSQQPTESSEGEQK